MTTFTVSQPMFVGVCLFVGFVMVSGILSICKKTAFFMIPGTVLGIVFGGIVLVAGYLAAAEAVKVKAAEIAYQARLDQMPPDWRKMYTLLRQTDDDRMRKAYFSAFIRDKHEPELTIDAFNEFVTLVDDCPCSNQKWKEWAVDELERFLIVDLDKIFDDMASITVPATMAD